MPINKAQQMPQLHGRKTIRINLVEHGLKWGITIPSVLIATRHKTITPT